MKRDPTFFPFWNKSQLFTFTLFILFIYYSKFTNYLLFHSLAELFSVVVACGIFMVSWNSKSFQKHSYFTFLGIAYLFVALLDIYHILSYPGMMIFQKTFSGNLSIQIWIANRYMESLSILLAFFFFSKKIRPKLVFSIYTFISIFLLGSIFYWTIFPTCFVDGKGITPFKRYSEYLICFILSVSLIPLYRNRKYLAPKVGGSIFFSILFTIFSELAFTLYKHPYGMANSVGHCLKIISFYLLYKAVIEATLNQPYQLMFQDLSLEVEKYKHTEKALQKSESQLKQITNNMPAMMVYIDQKQTYQYINKQYSHFFKTSPKELIGKTILENLGEKNYHLLSPKIEEVLEGKVVEFEVPYLSEETTSISHLQITYVPDLQDQKVVGFFVLILDITEKIKAQEEHKSSEKKLEEAIHHRQKMNSLGVLAGGIAHEFNNILGTMQGFTELALENLPSESEESEYLQKVYQSGERASHLIKQILTFSRRESRPPLLVSLVPIVQDFLAMIRATIPATITIHPIIDPDCPPVLVDSSKVHQVLLNITTNAIHAMEKKGGRLEISLEKIACQNCPHPSCPHHSDLGALLLSISDTGCGISTINLKKIFDPFFTTKKVGVGTGLGLSVAHGIMENFNGNIHVESTLGKGTKIILLFPVATGKIQGEETFHPTCSQGKGSILIVDDESTLLQLYTIALERAGYICKAFQSSEVAFSFFEKQPNSFDLIFTDYNMPHLRGDHLCEKIKKIRSNIPILMATGYNEEITEKQEKNMEIQKIFQKPIKMVHLIWEIQKVLSQYI